MKKMLFIINPCSGKKIIQPKICEIVDIFIKGGYDVTLYISQAEMDVKNKIKEATEYDLIVGSGGDGTFNEMISACIEMHYDKPIGYIPAGTTNDYANSLNLPKDPIKCAKMIVNGNYVCCDLGTLNDRGFSYIAAFGALTDISYNTPQATKNVLGHSAYILEGVKQLFDLKKYNLKISYEGNEIDDVFCYGMVTNTLSIGGYHFFSEDNVDLNDGWFECLFIKYPNSMIDYQHVLQALISKELDKCDCIYLFRAKNITISSDKEIAWTLDGEYGGSYSDVVLKNHNKTLKIFKENNRKDD